MVLWGKISHFSVFMILQLLASHEKTGVLELEDNQERAAIYLTDGRVDAVSVPRSDHMLGSRLVKGGHLTEVQLRRVILASGLKGENEFLGLTLLKSGLVKPEVVVAAVREQAYDNTLELSNWVRGTFSYDEPAEPVRFPISPQINVQHLLLEVSRRLDEGQRPSREKPELPGHDLCAHCSSECSPEQRRKYLRDGICLWRNMAVRVRESIFDPGNEEVRMYEQERHAGDLPFL